MIFACVLKRGLRDGGTVPLKPTSNTLRGQIQGSEAAHSMSLSLERTDVIRIYKIKAVCRVNKD